MEFKLLKRLKNKKPETKNKNEELFDLPDEYLYIIGSKNEANAPKQHSDIQTSARYLWMSGWFIGSIFTSFLLIYTGLEVYDWERLFIATPFSLIGVGIVMVSDYDFFSKLDNFGSSYWWISLSRGLVSGVVGRLVALIIMNPDVLDHIKFDLSIIILSGSPGIGKIPLIDYLEKKYSFTELKKKPLNQELFNQFLENPEKYSHLYHMHQTLRYMEAEVEGRPSAKDVIFIMNGSYRDVIWSYVKPWHWLSNTNSTDYSWENWEEFGEVLNELYEPPFLAINLTCKPKVMWERAQKYDKRFAKLLIERGINDRYLEIHENFRIEGFVKSFLPEHTMKIDVSKLDLHQDSDALNFVSKEINNKIQSKLNEGEHNEFEKLLPAATFHQK